MHEESIRSHSSLLYQDKDSLGDFFSLFGVQWVLPTTIKGDTFELGWVFCGKKKERKFGEQAHCVFFGQFGTQGTKLHLRKKCCQSKDLRVLLFISYSRRQNCS